MQVFCFYISLCTYSKFDAICIMHLHIHLTTSGIYHRPYAQRYVVFVPGESYFGYIADAFLRAELCSHPPIHFQHSLTQCPRGCLTSPRGGVPTALKYSSADARLTHWVCQSVQ